MEVFVHGLAEILIENIVRLVFVIAGILVSAFGAWVMKKIGKNEDLKSITAATENVINLAGITIGELQQTVVNDLKEAAKDGKLSNEEVINLGNKLIEKTLEKMSQPVYDLLISSGVDVIALIKGAGEDWINTLKRAD